MPNLSVRIGDTSTPTPDDALSSLDLVATGADSYHLVHDGKTYTCELVACDLPRKQLTVSIDGKRVDLKIEDEVDRLVQQLGLGVVAAEANADVHAPMPGLVIEVLVKAGDTVSAGDPLLVLEAMKMENSLTAAADGTVETVHVSKGDAVEKQQLLIELA